MGPIGCPETLLNDYQHVLSIVREQTSNFNTFRGQGVEFCYVEAGGMCRNQCPAQGQERNGSEMCMPGTFNSVFILIFPSHALVSW